MPLLLILLTSATALAQAPPVDPIQLDPLTAEQRARAAQKVRAVWLQRPAERGGGEVTLDMVGSSAGNLVAGETASQVGNIFLGLGCFCVGEGEAGIDKFLSGLNPFLLADALISDVCGFFCAPGEALEHELPHVRVCAQPLLSLEDEPGFWESAGKIIAPGRHIGIEFFGDHAFGDFGGDMVEKKFNKTHHAIRFGGGPTLLSVERLFVVNRILRAESPSWGFWTYNCGSYVRDVLRVVEMSSSFSKNLGVGSTSRVSRDQIRKVQTRADKHLQALLLLLEAIESGRKAAPSQNVFVKRPHLRAYLPAFDDIFNELSPLATLHLKAAAARSGDRWLRYEVNAHFDHVRTKWFLDEKKELKPYWIPTLRKIFTGMTIEGALWMDFRAEKAWEVFAAYCARDAEFARCPIPQPADRVKEWRRHNTQLVKLFAFHEKKINASQKLLEQAAALEDVERFRGRKWEVPIRPNKRPPRERRRWLEKRLQEAKPGGLSDLLYFRSGDRKTRAWFVERVKARYCAEESEPNRRILLREVCMLI